MHSAFSMSALQFSRNFPDFCISMIIFKAFQGLENFYIKFQDFLYFSRICRNPVTLYQHKQLVDDTTGNLQTKNCRIFKSRIWNMKQMHFCRNRKTDKSTMRSQWRRQAADSRTCQPLSLAGQDHWTTCVGKHRGPRMPAVVDSQQPSATACTL